MTFIFDATPYYNNPRVKKIRNKCANLAHAKPCPCQTMLLQTLQASLITTFLIATNIATLNVQAYKELGLLFILVAVAILTFSSLVYFAEKVFFDR